jgi:hypothetical protein
MGWNFDGGSEREASKGKWEAEMREVVVDERV